MRLATFNVQNMRLRAGEGGALRLDGARDADLPRDAAPGAARFDRIDRRLTAEILTHADADVVALQEVFDQATLDYFHDKVLTPAGAAPYPHRVCLPGNDGRGFDVALMSRIPTTRIESHAAATPHSLQLAPTPGCASGERIFRRDCIEATIGPLTLFVCHFKAPYPDADASWRIRRLEAEAVATLIRRRFPDAAQGLWIVAGDLNEPGDAADGDAAAIRPLLGELGVDLMLRLPETERWSFHQQHSTVYSRPDALIGSPALAERFPTATPRVLRGGLDRDAERYRGPRLSDVGRHRPHASDHAALVLDLPGL